MSDTLLYAGYGANCDLQMMEAIIGNVPNSLGTVAIQGVELCVQRYDQISNEVVNTAPVAISPKQIIEGAWSEKTDFETYAIRPKEGSVVTATLFELTPLQRALVAEWELVEFGWYNRMNVTVESADGTKIEAETEGFMNNQDIDRVVNGQDYETFLAEPSIMFKTAEKARITYLEQL